MPWQQVIDAASAEFTDLGDISTATRVILRLVLAGGVGAVLGFEREAMGKSAGIRTHMLVAIGSAMFILAPQEAGADDASISRVIQGLLAGIGFLGAGAIVKGRPGEEIQGLTTAASIWMTAALGMTAGLGRGVTAIIGAILALVVLRAMPGGGANGPNQLSTTSDSGSQKRPPTNVESPDT